MALEPEMEQLLADRQQGHGHVSLRVTRERNLSSTLNEHRSAFFLRTSR